MACWLDACSSLRRPDQRRRAAGAGSPTGVSPVPRHRDRSLAAPPIAGRLEAGGGKDHRDNSSGGGWPCAADSARASTAGKSSRPRSAANSSPNRNASAFLYPAAIARRIAAIAASPNRRHSAPRPRRATPRPRPPAGCTSQQARDGEPVVGVRPRDRLRRPPRLAVEPHGLGGPAPLAQQVAEAAVILDQLAPQGRQGRIVPHHPPGDLEGLAEGRRRLVGAAIRVLGDREVPEDQREESAEARDLSAPRIRHPAVSGRTAEDPQPIEALDAALLEQDAEVVEARWPGRAGTQGSSRWAATSRSRRAMAAARRRRGLGHPAVVGVQDGEQVVGVGQLALVGDPVRGGPDQAAPQARWPARTVAGPRRPASWDGPASSASLPRFMQHGPCRRGGRDRRADRAAPPRARPSPCAGSRSDWASAPSSRWMMASRSCAAARPALSVGSSPRCADEVLIVGQGRAQQVAPHRLEARHVEELALADAGQQLVDGGAGLGEVGQAGGDRHPTGSPRRSSAAAPRARAGRRPAAAGPRPAARARSSPPLAIDRIRNSAAIDAARVGVAPAPSPRPLGRPDPPRQDRTAFEVSPQVLGHRSADS